MKSEILAMHKMKNPGNRGFFFFNGIDIETGNIFITERRKNRMLNNNLEEIMSFTKVNLNSLYLKKDEIVSMETLGRIYIWNLDGSLQSKISPFRLGGFNEYLYRFEDRFITLNRATVNREEKLIVSYIDHRSGQITKSYFKEMMFVHLFVFSFTQVNPKFILYTQNSITVGNPKRSLLETMQVYIPKGETLVEIEDLALNTCKEIVGLDKRNLISFAEYSSNDNRFKLSAFEVANFWYEKERVSEIIYILIDNSEVIWTYRQHNNYSSSGGQLRKRAELHPTLPYMYLSDNYEVKLYKLPEMELVGIADISNLEYDIIQLIPSTVLDEVFVFTFISFIKVKLNFDYK